MVLTVLQLEVFLFILARIMGIFIQAPVFSSRSFPAFAKTALAIWVAIILWFVVPINLHMMPQNFLGFIFCLITETFIGFSIGFVCDIIFLGIQSAGEIIDLQMGLSVSQAFDPMFGASISIIGRLLFFMALTLFLILDGHHMLLSVLFQSFKLIPAPALVNLNSPNLAMTVLNATQNLWVIAIQIAGPIILVIFLSDFAFGIVSRVAPQVNVFMLGFQVKPVLGLVALIFLLPLLVQKFSSLLGTMAEEMIKLVLAIRI